MISRIRVGLLGVAMSVAVAAGVRAASPVDCTCVDNLPGLLTNACEGVVPDLCQLAAPCFASNVVPGSCVQSPPAGTLVGPGVTSIVLTVMDSQSNIGQCVVAFVVEPPTPTLSLICVPGKTVECGSAWAFDEPTPVTTCCDTSVSMWVEAIGTVTNGTCPRVITRTWQATNYPCGLSATCSQTVVVRDTTPPVSTCSGINLVPNPQFDNYAWCPTFFSQLASAVPWYPPTVATPDYLTACAIFPQVGVPTNWFGQQVAYSGNGYGGAYVYSTYGGNSAENSYREYLQTPLIAPMVSNQSYYVSFRVSLADTSGWAIADIGAHFSAGPVLSYSSQGVLSVVPQIANPVTNILAATGSWMLIQGIYTATGGEDHLTLGNFLTDAATTAAPASGTYSNFSYYYYDDVHVERLCPPESTGKTVVCGTAWSFDPPTGVDVCSGSNVAVGVGGTVTNSLCPLVITRTWLLTDLCGNVGTWSQTVGVVDYTPPMVNCECLLDSALALLHTNACEGVVPSLAPFTNCFLDTCGPVTTTQSPPAGTLVGTGVHPITVTVFDCSGNSNVCVVPFQVDPPVPVIAGPTNLVLLTCSNSAVAYFTATATGNVGPVAFSPPSGSAFPLGTNVVTCTATSACGGVATCAFTVTVKRPTPRWSCLKAVLWLESISLGNAHVVNRPDRPDGDIGVEIDNLGSSGQDGVRLSFGPAQQFTFSTYLDFTAPDNAAIDVLIPPGPGETNGTPLLSFQRSCRPRCGWNIKVAKRYDDPGAAYRAIAVTTNGGLLSSFTQDGATLETNILASIAPAPGVTGALLTVTVDCRTREILLDFPYGDWTPNAARKGWDGLIYGEYPRKKKYKQTARLVFTPVTTNPPPPIVELDLVASNLPHVAFDNPSLTSMNRAWYKGHVTVLKAHDDGGGVGTGIDFTSFGDGGGASANLGYASAFQFRLDHFQGSDVPNQEVTLRIKGGPSLALTNRPAPPTNYLRLAQSAGSVGIGCAVDFTQWGVSNVTLQLWDGTTLVGETNHVPASLASSLVTLGGFPGVLGCPGVGVLSLSDTNPVVVLSGLDCPSGACVGTELRILAELEKGSQPPVAFTDLDVLTSDGMDNRITGLETVPACSPVPLTIAPAPGGIRLNWAGDGFRVQGAEAMAGPWYDLGVESPSAVPAPGNLRAYRLICD